MEYIADPFGFPMVWVQDARAYVHCLPVTHVQMDMLLERGGHARGADTRARSSPPTHELDEHNYTQAFVTGIAPNDTLRLARCFEDLTGEQFRLPSPSEWHATYRALAERPFGDELTTMLTYCRDQARVLSNRLRSILEGPVQESVPFRLRLADRLLFRLGVMEWVRLPGKASVRGQRYAGMGLPARHSWPSLCDPELQAPVEPRPDQGVPPFGFRLWRSVFPEQSNA